MRVKLPAATIITYYLLLITYYLFQGSQFFANLNKSSDTFVEVCFLVSGRDLYTDTCLFFRNDRIIESRHINAFFLHACGINLREFGIIQHNGADGTLCRFDVKSGSCHLVTEIVYILYQLVMQRIAFFQHLEYFETCTDDTRSQRVGEQIRTAALTQ